MELRIAVCEDELVHQERIHEMIHQWSESKKVSVIIDTYESGEQFIHQYDQKIIYDIVFMDIHLSGIDGVKISRKLRERDERMMLVFTTSRMEYVIQGYEVNAWRFLLKPIHFGDISLCLNKSYELYKSGEEFFFVKEDGKLHKIEYDKIYFLEAYGHYVSIYTKDNIFTMRITINQLEQQLTEIFFRNHRSYIINLKLCDSIEENQVTILGHNIPISNSKKKEMLEKINTIYGKISYN